MSNGVEVQVSSRSMGRSILALFAGFVVNVVLSLVTDFALQFAGVLYMPMNDRQSALAAAYRTIYAVIGSYVIARLAPYRPVQHALFGAAMGMVIAAAGAAATWNKNLGPHWYPVVLILTALPTGWVGAKIWMANEKRMIEGAHL
jgi:hypothetical protein